MTTIDPTARIEDGAVIGEGTSIGPYCMIGPHVVIGADCNLVGACPRHRARTTIGAGCTIYPFASLGDAAAILELSRRTDTLQIGEGCCIREVGDHERRHRGRAAASPASAIAGTS